VPEPVHRLPFQAIAAGYYQRTQPQEVGTPPHFHR
jgi:hypothetical protein